MPCGQCQFWVCNADGSGECRRHAPVSRDPLDHFGQWPQTLHSDDCGDFTQPPSPVDNLKPIRFEVYKAYWIWIHRSKEDGFFAVYQNRTNGQIETWKDDVLRDVTAEVHRRIDESTAA